MNKVKITYPKDLFDPSNRNLWFELLKSKERFERKGSELDKNIQSHLEWIDSMADADLLVLPMSWNIYYARKQEKEAFTYCQQADSFGKTVLSLSGGDQGITVSVPSNTIVYRQGGYRSKMKANERTAPFFLSDPVVNFIKIAEEKLFENHNSQVKVGFCGMAPHGLKTEIKERSQIIFRNLKSRLGFVDEDAQAVLSSSNLRYKTLEIFRKSPDFESNYIIRQKYRGGVQTEENRKKTTEEYYQNQIESDLVICARGVGNFSLRLYETLAMGRIPVFIDTDSPLPDIGEKNWNDYIIWVDSKEVQNAPEIAKSWLANRDLNKQKRLNRQFWVEHFRGDNFWIKELEKLILDKTKND